MSPPSGKLICILSAARSGSRMIRSMLARAFEAAEVPYDANFIWLKGTRADSDLRTSSDASPLLQERIMGLLREASGDLVSEMLVEKTISNSIRPGYVESLVPAARFVVLVRNPAGAIASSARCWSGAVHASDSRRKLGMVIKHNRPFLLHQLIQRLTLSPRTWGVRYPGITSDLESRSIDEICALQWAWSVRSSAEWLASGARQDVPVLVYDSLTRPGAIKQALEVIDPVAAKRAQEFGETDIRRPARSADLPELAADVQGQVDQALEALLGLPQLAGLDREVVASWRSPAPASSVLGC